jgi:hypothetical protein
MESVSKPSTWIVVALALWMLEAMIVWAWGAPLGHDEAQYALAARAALSGQPPPWNYLSFGMNLLAIPGVLLGGSEQALRWVPLCAGLGFALAVAGLARRRASAARRRWGWCSWCSPARTAWLGAAPSCCPICRRAPVS